MPLFTKCILKEPEQEDGIRISVMSRHTLPDGVTPDSRIKSFDIHMPILGPSPKLVGDYYKRNLPWNEFEKRYIDEISEGSKSQFVRRMAKMAMNQNVTLLCVEETCEHCHRRLLAETCQKYEPNLNIEYR